MWTTSTYCLWLEVQIRSSFFFLRLGNCGNIPCLRLDITTPESPSKEWKSLNWTEMLLSNYFYKSSKIMPWSDSAEDQAAAKIVEDLDHLPLAIDQGAAYIREVAKKFSTFLIDYAEYRRDLSNWAPQGIRQYPHTVATTWRMSFTAISGKDPTAVELLRLISFLNPDGILIKFLQSGANGT
jgi:hypothetical protein